MYEVDLGTMMSTAHGHAAAASAPGLERQHNAVLTQIDMSCTSDVALALPAQHYVSTSDACNIECHYCPRQSYYGDRWENGFLPVEAFREKLGPLARAAQLFGLYGLGEPFLHRDFFEFVRVVKEAGAMALTNCHGMSLRPKVNEHIIASGLDRLNVSMDGATEETFNLLREKADLETVKRQVKDLVARRDAAGRMAPAVYLAAMINAENIGELPEMVRMAKELGAEQIDFSDTVICNPEDLESSVSGLPIMWEKIDEAKALGRELGVRVEYSLQKPFPWRPIPPAEQAEPCPQVCELAWGTWLVGKRGEVKPCCFIEWEYGNAFTDEPQRIQNGPEARELRRRLMSGDIPRECRGCGCAQPLTERHQRQALDRAEELLQATEMSEAERARLREIIAGRRALVDARWGHTAAHVPA